MTTTTRRDQPGRSRQALIILTTLVVTACGSGGADNATVAGADAVDGPGVGGIGTAAVATAEAEASRGETPLSRKVSAADATAPIYRFARISTGAYLFTGDENEKNVIISTYPDYRYEGSTFGKSTGVGSTPVYRFASLTGNGAYFYTSNPAERDATIANYASIYRFEGSSFSVESGPNSQSYTTYRLANLRNGAYLYTIDPAERTAAVATGIWRDEGIVFNTRPTNLRQCIRVANGASTAYLQCSDLTLVPSLLGSFSGRSLSGSACSFTLNAIGDMSLAVDGVVYASRLDASTVYDITLLNGRMPVTGSVPGLAGALADGYYAHNPLDGSAIEVDLVKSGASAGKKVAFHYRDGVNQTLTTTVCIQ